MTVSLAGLTLHVADVDRSLACYQQLAGATILFHLPGRFALLRFGAGRLGLLADRQRPFHVELEVPDLDAAVDRLRQLGVTGDGPTVRAWGERDFLVTDPDGNLLEFSAARSADHQALPDFRRLQQLARLRYLTSTWQDRAIASRHLPSSRNLKRSSFPTNRDPDAYRLPANQVPRLNALVQVTNWAAEVQAQMKE